MSGFLAFFNARLVVRWLRLLPPHKSLSRKGFPLARQDLEPIPSQDRPTPGRTVLVICSILVAACICYRHMGHVPWAFLIFMAAVYMFHPPTFAVLVFVGIAAFLLTHLR